MQPELSAGNENEVSKASKASKSSKSSDKAKKIKEKASGAKRKNARRPSTDVIQPKSKKVCIEEPPQDVEGPKEPPIIAKAEKETEVA